MKKNTVIIDGRQIEFNGERNILEVIRKANIDLPTFCYHSELSVYGACRLCLVDIDGRGICSSCSLPPEAGMEIKTNTQEIREIRKISIELLLANHEQNCNTCSKSNSCKLQELANRFGIDKIRFKKIVREEQPDISSHSLVRDPNKCILCGDCVRACSEIQGIGAIDFAFRGSASSVVPAFGKDLAEGECVDCGQCARVCPTGSLVPKSEIDQVWDVLDDSRKYVVVQFAPAVRVAIGEMFGMKPGTVLTGQIATALKMLGFNKVYDTSYAADLTVIEEANEFLARKEQGKKLPLFTSCCPAWVKYAEQYYPEMLPNLSSCKSPQQMFGSVVKEIIPKQEGISKKDFIVVSIMPCTAKKTEARRPEFRKDGIAEVDYVLTTQELARMIKQAGIQFDQLTPGSVDNPFGYKTGAGVLFGNSGGVSEAVVRYAYEKITGAHLSNPDILSLRGADGIREAEIDINGEKLNLAVVHGLKNAKSLMKKVKAGQKHYDLIEVMACPGGCVGGAGQPVSFTDEVRNQRAQGIYAADKMLGLHKSQENPFVNKLYETHLKEPGSREAHHLLHTKFQNRKQIAEDKLSSLLNNGTKKIEVNVCVGTGCHLKSSETLHKLLRQYVEVQGIEELVEVNPTFCMDNCGEGPSVSIGGKLVKNSSFKKICALIQSELSEILEEAAV